MIGVAASRCGYCDRGGPKMASAATRQVGLLRIPRIFYGWWIVVAGFFAVMVSTGFAVHGVSTLVLPLEREFGWSRSAITGAFSLARVESGVLGPLSGWLTDRIGPRKMMIGGALLTAGGYFLLAHVTTLPMLYIVFIGGIVIGASVGFSTPVSAAVANWFQRKRGRAFGLMWAGHGMSGLTVFLLATMITAWGWRSAVTVAGILILIAGLPAAMLMRRRPEDYGMLPDGGPSTGPEAIQARSKRISRARQAAEDERTGNEYRARQALRTPAFWFIGISGSSRHLATAGVSIHFIALLAGPLSPIAVSETAAAALFAVMTVISNIGRIGMSWMGDFLSKRYLMAWGLAAMTGAVVVMGLSKSLVTFVPAAMVFGIGWGGLSALPNLLRADYFGRNSYATIQGWNQLVEMGGVLAGPLLAAVLYDRTHSYVVAFLVFAVTCFVGMLFMDE
jgi:MFS family permease